MNEGIVDTTLWCVNITGPDDVIAVASRLEAIDLAARFNEWWMRTSVPTLHPYDPTMWAVPISWPHNAESHSTSLGDVGEYGWLRELPASAALHVPNGGPND